MAEKLIEGIILDLVQVNLHKMFQIFPITCYFKRLGRGAAQNHAKMLI